jgi:Ni/Fe-hydrogenase subunit HybB-like protein
MSGHTDVHTPVGGRLMTGPMKVLLLIVGIGAMVTLWRFFTGIASVSNLNDGYPWGVWISIDVVVGTAIGCGGFAIGLLVYILNKGQYHPLVRPAVLTSLLGYGLAVIAVMIDLGRWWGLWKVPTHIWRWTHSPQLEVALCVAAYVMVLLVEISPAFFEKWKDSSNPTLRSLSERGISFMERALVWVLALGLLLPAMHQSSLGTMMLLPGPRMNPLWSTPWLPFFFLVNCIIIGFAVVVLEATFSAVAFGRKRETTMLASLSKVIAWVATFWVAFRVVEVAITGKFAYIASGKGIAFLGEVVLTLIGALILFSGCRHVAGWQVRAAMLLLLGGIAHRVNTYLVAFTPGENYSYFPSVPELFITFGIIAAEVAIYLAIVKTFPILSGKHSAAGKEIRGSV